MTTLRDLPWGNAPPVTNGGRKDLRAYLAYASYVAYAQDMSEELSYRDFRENLADILNRIEYREESFTITRRGKPVANITPHTSRYGPTYAYRIDITEDGETWTPYRHEARGIEKAFMNPEKLANLILTNHLADIRTNGEPDSETRVLVWRDAEGLDTEAVATAEYGA